MPDPEMHDLMDAGRYGTVPDFVKDALDPNLPTRVQRRSVKDCDRSSRFRSLWFMPASFVSHQVTKSSRIVTGALQLAMTPPLIPNSGF